MLQLVGTAFVCLTLRMLMAYFTLVRILQRSGIGDTYIHTYICVHVRMYMCVCIYMACAPHGRYKVYAYVWPVYGICVCMAGIRYMRMYGRYTVYAYVWQVYSICVCMAGIRYMCMYGRYTVYAYVWQVYGICICMAGIQYVCMYGRYMVKNPPASAGHTRNRGSISGW